MAEKKLLCSINLKDCTSEAQYVCHHCGRPLCDGPNCCKWIMDAAFTGWPAASHCPECDHLFWVLKLFRNGIDWLRLQLQALVRVL